MGARVFVCVYARAHTQRESKRASERERGGEREARAHTHTHTHTHTHRYAVMTSSELYFAKKDEENSKALVKIPLKDVKQVEGSMSRCACACVLLGCVCVFARVHANMSGAGAGRCLPKCAYDTHSQSYAIPTR